MKTGEFACQPLKIDLFLLSGAKSLPFSLRLTKCASLRKNFAVNAPPAKFLNDAEHSI
jgi:hypothetical protein